MISRGILLAGAALATLSASPAWAEPAHKAKHHHASDSGPSVKEQLSVAQQQIALLQAQLSALEAKVDQQNAAQTATASQVAVASQTASEASTRADKAVAVADAAQAASAHPAVPEAVKWAAGTQIGGQLFFNESTIRQHTAGLNNPASGTGFNVKRMYITIDHQFSPVFSARFVTDISNVIGETANTNFVNPTANTSTGAISSQAIVGKGIYLKNAYLQAKLDPALVIRAGAAPLPWVPYIEGQYGFRYIENTTLDRLSYGTTADWGVHVLGDLAGGLVSYQVSAIDGAGYRNVKVTKSVDLEGRLSVQYQGLFAAVGGYTGKRGNDTQATGLTPTTFHTAKRLDFGAGYKSALFTVGGEYYYAKNWNNVAVNPATNAFPEDSAKGYSLFGNVNFAPRWTVFGRYDWNKPNRLTDPALRDRYFNVGLQWEPVKIVDVALVYKREVVSNGAIATSNGVIGCSTTPTANAFASVAARNAGICSGSGSYDEFGVFGQLKF